MSLFAGHVRTALGDVECVLEAQHVLRRVVDAVVEDHAATERARLEEQCRRLSERSKQSEERVAALEAQRNRFSKEAAGLAASFQLELAQLQARDLRVSRQEMEVRRTKEEHARQRRQILRLKRSLLRMRSQLFPIPHVTIHYDSKGKVANPSEVLSGFPDAFYRALWQLVEPRDRTAFSVCSLRLYEHLSSRVSLPTAMPPSADEDAAVSENLIALLSAAGGGGGGAASGDRRRHSFALGNGTAAAAPAAAAAGAHAQGPTRRRGSFAEGSGGDAVRPPRLRPAEMREVLRMRKEVEALRRREAEQREEREDLHARAEALAQARSVLVGQLRKVQADLAAAERQASASQEVATFLDQRVRELETELGSARHRMSDAEDEVSSLRERLRAQEAECEHLRERHQMEVEQEQEVVAAQEAEMKQLEDAFAAERAQWKREKRVLVGEVRTLRLRLAAAGGEEAADAQAERSAE